VSADRSDERLEESSRVPAESAVSSPSRGRTILRTILAVVVGGGVLWWVAQTVLSGGHAAKKAIREMGSHDPAVRVGAIQELETAGRGNGEIAIPPLIVALGDEDTRTRTAAAVALGAIGTDAVRAGSLDDLARRAIAALLGALKDPEPSVRVAAANALSSIVSSKKADRLIDPKATVVALTESLKEPKAEVRQASLRLLALVAPATGGDPPKELAGAMKDETAGNRSAAVIALVSFPSGLDPWIPSLCQVIEADKAPAVREAVVARVAAIHPPAITAAAIPDLIAVLGRPDGQVRDTACRVLMSFGPEARAAIPALIAMANETWSDSTDVEHRRLNLDCLAIQALTKIALKTDSAGQIIAALTELVQEKSPNRCARAVHALGEFGPAAESAVPTLIRALPWKLPSPANSRVLDPPVVIAALGRIATGPKSSAEFIAALGRVMRTGEQRGIQADAADALGKFGPAAEAAVPDLIRAIEATDPKEHDRVSWRASVALGRIAPRTKSASDAIAALQRSLHIPEPGFRIGAADALGEFGPAAEPAIPDLIQILEDSTGKGGGVQVMASAARALMRIAPGTPSREEAMRAMTAAIPRLRERAKEVGQPWASEAAEDVIAKIEGSK
jgi:HEAT repeat protein